MIDLGEREGDWSQMTPDDRMIHWRRCPWDDRYEVSTDGDVRKRFNGLRLSASMSSNGYFRVHIGGKRYWLHRVVGLTWLKGYSPGLEINHKDGDPSNNRAENLEWVTHQENMAHAAKMCSWAKGAQRRAIFQNPA